MSIIDIKNLTFRYEGAAEYIFEKVNLEISTAWKSGLVGRNGKGKTTLLKLLTGELEYSGTIRADVEFEYFPYPVADISAPLYCVLQQVCPCFEEWKVRRELNLLEVFEVDFYRPFNTYSEGERTKILLAAMFCKDNAFLLIDEPTNHLDKCGRALLSRYLNKKSAYIVVSHDRRFLDGCIDRVISINRAAIEVQNGNLSSYLQNKKRQDDFEEAENQKLLCDIKRLTEAGKRRTVMADKAEEEKWGGHCDRGYLGAKAARVMKQAINMRNRIDAAVEEKSTLLKNIDRADSLGAAKSQRFFKERLLTVKDLVIFYGNRQINEPLSFEIDRGERVSLWGRNGSGKSSVLKAVLGELPYKGTIERNRQLKISYLPQDTSFLKGSFDDFCARGGVDKTRLLTFLFKLGLERSQFEKSLEEQSQGQKKKLLLAKSLCEQAHLFIWDEPLNYIDVISREQIKEVILNSGISLLLVEHDAAFIDEVATKEVEIK